MSLTTLPSLADSAKPKDPAISHARLKLAFLLAALGEHGAAVEECDTAAEKLGPAGLGPRSFVLGMAGRAREARQVLRQLVTEVENADADPYGVALGHIGLGDPASALDWLNRSLEYRSRDLVLQ